MLVSPIPKPLLPEITGNDYGCDYHENPNALTLISRTGNIPTQVTGNPPEVCCLMRWSDEHQQPFSDRKSVLAFHHNRAFACCILIMAEVEQLIEEECNTLVQFVHSILTPEQPNFCEVANGT